MSDARQDPPLDGVALDRLVALGGETFLAQMIDIVLPQAEARIAAARAGLQEGDLAAVRMAVHSLRSTAGNVGAPLLLALAGQAEELAAGQRAAELGPLLDALAAEWERVRERLLERRRSLP